MLKATRSGGILTIGLSGEIDHCVCEALRGEVETMIADAQIKRLILDFTDVSFMDSSGVGMIIGRYKTMRARGGSVGAIGLHPPVDRLFRLAGLHRIIQIEPSGRQKNA